MERRTMTVLFAGLMTAFGVVALAEERMNEVVSAPVAVPVAAAAVVETPIAITTVDLSPAYPWTQNEFEKRFAPELEAEKTGVEWKKNVKLVDGTCDLIAQLGQIEWKVVYARVVLDAADNCKVCFSMGSDDGISVIINGKTIYGNNVMRTMTPNRDRAYTELVKGMNEVLFRVTQGDGAMSFQVAAKVLGATKVIQVPAVDKPAPAAPMNPANK
jgi:hypothetical protein